MTHTAFVLSAILVVCGYLIGKANPWSKESASSPITEKTVEQTVEQKHHILKFCPLLVEHPENATWYPQAALLTVPDGHRFLWVKYGSEITTTAIPEATLTNTPKETP